MNARSQPAPEPPPKFLKEPLLPKGFQRRSAEDLIQATDYALNWSGRNLKPPEFSWFLCTYAAEQKVGDSFVIYQPATLL
jgi:hypothetical protein